jgi:hypothetical protein
MAAAVFAAILASASVSRAGPLVLADPPRAGESAPPAGQSLFDDLFRDGGGHDLPYPFEKLTASVERSNDGERARAVLIPLGRSLQRLAADPDYFSWPRVVLAVDKAGARAVPYLKDRLFIAYQERSTSMEVISYNEAAGRFEFQVVSNYTGVGKPLVEYADRALCTACHQGNGPIFPIAQWNESNANPGIADRMAGLGAAFHGVPVRRGIDEADAIDQAVGRANRLALGQFVWQRVCGAASGMEPEECRSRLLLAALRWRLGGARGPWLAAGDSDLAGVLHAAIRTIAPDGIAVASPSIPDRDPLIELGAGVKPMEVVEPEGVYDPSRARAPRLLVEASAKPADTLAAAIAEIGGFFSPRALARLAAALAGQGGPATAFTAPCTLDHAEGEVRFECAGDGLKLSGHASASGGMVTRLALKGYAPLTGLKILPGARGSAMSLALVENSFGLPARLPTGERLSALRIAGGMARISVTDDMVALRRAVAAAGLYGDGPLRASAVEPALAAALRQGMS